MPNLQSSLRRLSCAVLLLATLSCSAADTPPAERGRPDGIPASVHELLSSPDTIELLALDPLHVSMHTAEGQPEFAGPQLHGYEILETAELADPLVQGRLLGLIYKGIEDSDGRVAACFNPRHGVRVTHAGQVVEFVICYECLSMHVHAPAHDTPETRLSVLTAQAVEPEVSAIFRNASLTLAP